MKPRNPLNSDVLKNRFPEIYREFFSKCQLVASAPHFFTWAGEYVGYWGGIMLMQKIPLRIYVGLELIPIQKGKDRIILEDDARSYSIKEDKFEQDKYEHLAQKRLLKFLNQHSNLVKKTRQTIKLHVLSELPLGSTGSSDALSSALAVLLHLENKNIDLIDIQKWHHRPSKELIEKENLKFNKAFRTAWKISAAYRGGQTSGAAVFSTMLPSALPVFYCMADTQDLKLPLDDIDQNYEILNKIPIWGARINELFRIKEIPSWPIDFACVGVGEPRGITPFSTQELQETISQTNKFMNQNLKEIFKTDQETSPFFYRASLSGWQSSLQVMNFLSLCILINLGELLQGGSREDAVRSFLRSVDKHQILFLLLGVVPPQIEMVKAIAQQEARKIDELGAGIKSVSTNKKEVMLFTFPHGKSQKAIEAVSKRIKKDLCLDLQIMHASWLDGTESNGVEIEQNLNQEFYSDFISKNIIRVQDFSQNALSRLVLTPEEFQQQKNGIDLLLSAEEGKIYVRGKSLTSKEIHSKKATINLLQVLLQKRNEEVSNRDLPVSSYTLDRYELQGKIAAPLVKIIQQKTKKKLDLKVRGGVTDFFLKLDPGPVKIWLVESHQK